MLRKCLIFTFIIFFFLMIFQYGINFLKTEHSINYILTSGKAKYDINESYKKSSKADYYYFDLLYNDIHFLFEENNAFNKQKKVVKSVLTYDVDKMICATLVYINGEKSDLLCSKDNKLYSYIAFKDDYDFSKIAKDRFIKENKAVINKENVSLYSSYLYDDENILLYDYRRVLKYNPNGFLGNIVFSNKYDVETNYGSLVNNFYVIPKMSLSDDITIYYVFNVEMGSIYEIKSPIPLSKNIVNLGVYDDILYVLDKEKLNEFSIDIYDRKITQIADKKSNGIIYKNGSLEKVSLEEISNSNLKFEFFDNRYKDIECEQIFTFEKYAIYIKDNVFYKVYPEKLDNPIYLFSMENARQVMVKEDRIYFTVGDILYRFDDNGIYSLIKKDSLADNADNYYEIYISK